MMEEEKYEIRLLNDKIRILARFSGSKIEPPGDKEKSPFDEYEHWRYSGNNFRVFYVEKELTCYCIEYGGEPVFLYRRRSASSSPECYYTISISHLRSLIEAPADRATRIMKLGVYRRYAREVAQYLGKAVLSENFCGIDYYKDVYEDERIIIEAEQMIERDTKVYVKIGNGLRLVLDSEGYLDGKWMEYLRDDLVKKAWRMYRDNNHGVIDDSSVFS